MGKCMALLSQEGWRICRGFGSWGLSDGMCCWRVYKVSFLFLNGKLSGGNIRISTHTVHIHWPKFPCPHNSKVGTFALPSCKPGRGLCADVVEGRICWISINTICRLGSDECSVWKTSHFAYTGTNGIAKICRTYLVFSNNYWWVANICYFSPE